MTDNSVLPLRLEGVLQAWGSDAKWDTRGTDLYPTKSGVVGLIGCALGIPHDAPLLAEISADLRMGVRVDRTGTRLTDYQTVEGHPLLDAAGKKRQVGQTIVSRRDYLSDASFLVALEGPRERMTEISAALQAPVWPYYLGRKSCVASRPVIEAGEYDYNSIDDALRRHPLAERHDPGPEFACEVDGHTGDGARLSRSDEFIGGAGRRFGMRTVTRGKVRHASYETQS